MLLQILLQATNSAHSSQSPFSETRGKDLLPPRKGYESSSRRRDHSMLEERKEMPRLSFARSRFKRCKSSTPFSFPEAHPRPRTALHHRQSPPSSSRSPASSNLLPTLALPHLHPTAEIRRCSLCRPRGSLSTAPSLPSSPSHLITTIPSPPPPSPLPT